MSQEQFLEKVKSVHGDTYDYTDTIYINMKTKIRVVCPTHGVFEQLPQAHLRGQGCPLCGREKQVATLKSRYGVSNPMQSAEIFEKARKTCKERYGTEWATSQKSIQKKIETTNLNRYGVARPIQSSEIYDKMTDTVVARYGVENVGQASEIRAKMKDTCYARYGSSEILSVPSVRKKIKSTNVVRYGGIAPMCSQSVRDKMRDTVRTKYGVDSIMQCPDVLYKIRNTKAARGVFHTSAIEEDLFVRLCCYFGEDDVQRQYHSDVYPFACDFYIKSRNMYIELNGSWTHGKHWYSDSIEDKEIVDLWTVRNTKYYKNAIDVWTRADVLKRNTARQNQLNYIVFWDVKLRDVDLWFECGAPDGQDWNRMYSWIS